MATETAKIQILPHPLKSGGYMVVIPGEDRNRVRLCIVRIKNFVFTTLVERGHVIQDIRNTPPDYHEGGYCFEIIPRSQGEEHSSLLKDLQKALDGILNEIPKKKKGR